MLNEKEDIVFVYKSINDLNEILVSNEKKSSYLIPLLMVKQNDYENTISITQESVKKSLKKPIVIDVSQKNGSEIKEKLEDHNKSKEIIIITQIENMNRC